VPSSSTEQSDEAYLGVGGGTSAPIPNRGISWSLAIRSLDWNLPVQGQEEIDGMWMAGDGDTLAPEDGWRMAGRLQWRNAIYATDASPRRPSLPSPSVANWNSCPRRDGIFSAHVFSFLNLFHVKNDCSYPIKYFKFV